MNWEAISAVTEILGLVAVIVTIIYLAMQIRQSTRSIQASTEQTLMTQETDVYALLTAHPGSYLRGRKDLGSLDEEEAFIFENLIYTQMAQIYSGWVQFHGGLIPQEVWQAYVNGLKMDLAYPGIRAMWLEVQDTFPVSFQEMVRTECDLAL